VSTQSLTTFALIALMVVAFYFLIMRPQKKRQQAQQQTMNSLGPGSRVMTGSGLFGTVVSIGEKQAVIEVSPGVELTVLKQAIARVVTDTDEDSGADGDDDDEDTDEPDVVLDEQVVESELATDDDMRPGTDSSSTKD
jgi:preprotein translocase subunit YajC